MRFASLGSGSKGNGTLVQSGSTCVLIDCGFPRREAENRLLALGIEPRRLAGILVTHEHGDHGSGVGALSRAHDLDVFVTHGTAAALSYKTHPRIHRFDAGSELTLGDLRISAVPVPHDAREPVQYVLADDDHRLGVLTDLGSVSNHVVDAFGGCTGLLLECNHDPDLLRIGPYPATLKRRVGGLYGHLSNGQAADFLTRVDCSRLTRLVIGHLSEQNNSPERALAALNAAPVCHRLSVVVASQSEGFDWISLADGSNSMASLPSAAASA